MYTKTINQLIYIQSKLSYLHVITTFRNQLQVTAAYRRQNQQQSPTIVSNTRTFLDIPVAYKVYFGRYLRRKIK